MELTLKEIVPSTPSLLRGGDLPERSSRNLSEQSDKVGGALRLTPQELSEFGRRRARALVANLPRCGSMSLLYLGVVASDYERG